MLRHPDSLSPRPPGLGQSVLELRTVRLHLRASTKPRECQVGDLDHLTLSRACVKCSASFRLRFMEGAASTVDLFQDISGAGGPNERLGAPVVVIDVVSDRGDKLFDIAKDAAAQPVLSRIPKEAFHHVQPRRAGGREVHAKTRVTLKPALHPIVFVGAGVVTDHV